MLQKFNAFRFSVSGSGRFPVDMLRYDRCVPYTSEDAAKVGTRPEDDSHRTVNLIAFTPAGNQLIPTHGRWRSFGWDCGEAEPVTA